jgi:hypothetical protein
VVGAVWAAPDPAKACRELLAALPPRDGVVSG